MTRAPIRQSDSGVAAIRAHGCMIASIAWAADWATDGNAIPQGQDAIDSVLVRLRKDAGMTLEQFNDRGTTLDEAERAYEAMTVPGYMPLRMRKMHGGSVRDDILPELRDGKAAVIAVNYGAIQDAGRGVGSFRGGHGMVILNPENGRLEVIDPLRSEVVTMPLSLIEKAMETFGSNPWGNGRGEAGIVERTDTWKEGYEAATTALAVTKKALAAEKAAAQLARTAADELSASLQAANLRIQQLENATPPDCTTAVNAERARVLDAMVEALTETAGSLR